MKLYVIGNGFRYELENICRLFFPFENASLSVTFGDLNTAIHMAAAEIHEEPDNACYDDHRLTTEAEAISMLASLCAGGSVFVL